MVKTTISYNGSGVKEVLSKQNLDEAKRSLLHRVIRRAISLPPLHLILPLLTFGHIYDQLILFLSVS